MFHCSIIYFSVSNPILNFLKCWPYAYNPTFIFDNIHRDLIEANKLIINVYKSVIRSLSMQIQSARIYNRLIFMHVDIL